MKTITWRRNSTEAWQPLSKWVAGVTEYPTKARAQEEARIIRRVYPEAEVVILESNAVAA